MKTIWVIEQGSYSDYHVVGVFSSKGKAQLICDHLRSEYDSPSIAEWPIDPGVEGLSHGYSSWLGEMLYDGAVERMVERELSSDNLTGGLTLWKRASAPAYKGTNVPDCLHGTVLAKDRTHAIKIFNEKRTQLIALGKWNQI